MSAHLQPEAYPLFPNYQPNSILAWQGRRAITLAQFLDEAVTLAERLPAKQYALNLCDDRYHFLLGFTAALITRQVNLLPPSRAEAVLRRIYDDYDDAYCLIDRGDALKNLHSFSISSDVSRKALERTVPRIPAAQVAAIVFTSGTTGQPVAHEKTWGSLMTGAELLGEELGFEVDGQRSVLGTIPPQHMFGLETTVMFPLRWGCVLHAGRPVLPADIAASLRELPNPRWLMTTPLHMRACVAEGVRFSGLEGIISATMPLAETLAHEAERLWDTSVHEIYGCTEGGMIALRRTAEDRIWRVAKRMRIWQDGEAVWVAGRHIRKPLRLADRILVHNRREFTLYGRAGDMVKVAGNRTSLEALNAELIRIAGVNDGVFI
ncbi:MAG: AMP-binding protein, partial [Nitrospiraceae bacterium]